MHSKMPRQYRLWPLFFSGLTSYYASSLYSSHTDLLAAPKAAWSIPTSHSPLYTGMPFPRTPQGFPLHPLQGSAQCISFPKAFPNCSLNSNPTLPILFPCFILLHNIVILPHSILLLFIFCFSPLE